MSTGALLVLVTAPAEAAERLAQHLVELRLAACVNLLPQVASMYRWEGKVTRADETLLLIKTPAARFEALRTEVLAQHPYELPEIVAVDLAAAHAPYLEWIARSTQAN